MTINLNDLQKSVAIKFKKTFDLHISDLTANFVFNGSDDDKSRVVAQEFSIGILSALSEAVGNTPSKDFSSRLADTRDVFAGDHENDLAFFEDKAINSIKVGSTAYGPEGNLYVDEYLSGGTRLFVGATASDGLTASVYLDEETRKLPLNEVYLKGYSENRGMIEALVTAGVVRLTGKIAPAGFAIAQHAEIIGNAFKQVSSIAARKAC